MSFEFKDKADGKKLGKLLGEGIGVGLSESSYHAITAMENVYVELETLTKNAAKNAEKLAKKRQSRRLENLKNALNLEFITEQEYYERLKNFRDEELREGTDLWYKCTEEIAAYNQRMLEEAEEKYARILKLRDELAERLKNDEPWFSNTKVRFKGLGENGIDLVYSSTEIKSFREEIQLLESYRDRIVELQNLGGVPEGVFSDIADMDVEAGIKAVDAILLADEETRKKFFSGYAEYERLSQNTAAELLGILKSEELKEEGLEGFSEGLLSTNDNGRFAEILTGSFENVPASYFSLGEESGQAFGDGFMSKIPAIMEDAKVYFMVAINEIADRMSASLISGAQGAATAVSNSYTSTYNFNSSRDTTTQQLSAARNAEALTRLRGGNS